MSLRVNSTILPLAALLIGASVASPVAASGVVTRSSGPARASYPDGTRLDDNVTIVLTSDSQVTVVTTSGVRTLRGPGSFRIGDIDLPAAAKAAPPPYMPAMDSPDMYEGSAPQADDKPDVSPPEGAKTLEQQDTSEPSTVPKDRATEAAQKGGKDGGSAELPPPQNRLKDGTAGPPVKARPPVARPN